ncbi:MAG: SGNH/GDSL hydrolase family protein [Vicinamibacteria bacterium]
MRFRPRRLLSWTAYALFLALLAEAGARFLLMDEARLMRIGSPVSEASWRLRFVLRYARTGPAANPLEVPHRTRGWALVPGLRQVPAFAGRTVSSNAQGLRGVREHAVPKPAGTLRILAFGDSFTFGEDVSDAETYCHRLGGLLPGVEVLNFGVRGYGHDQMLVRLREEAARYQPDVVLLGYVTDDAIRNLSGFRDFAKPRFELAGGRLVLRGTPVPTPEEVIAAERWRPKVLDLVSMARQNAAWRSGRRQAEATTLTFAILREFFREVRRLGSRPLVVDLPVWDELRVAGPAPLPREHGLEVFCRAEGLPYLRLRPLFLAHQRAGGRLETRAHWGPVEHGMAAQAIADFVRERHLLAPAEGGIEYRPE